jgi:hypothetical protein
VLPCFLGAGQFRRDRNFDRAMVYPRVPSQPILGGRHDQRMPGESREEQFVLFKNHQVSSVIFRERELVDDDLRHGGIPRAAAQQVFQGEL